MKLLDIIKLKEFLPYFFIGGFTTLIDWSVFWCSLNRLHLNYGEALICAFVMASLFHFSANKWITFKCATKQLGSQYSVYIFVSLMSLMISLLCMTVFIKLIFLPKMIARIITTFLMLIPNYLTHKYITFNKNIFIQS